MPVVGASIIPLKIVDAGELKRSRQVLDVSRLIATEENVVKTADEIYFSGMFTIARVDNEEIELGPALERAGLILISREEWESFATSTAGTTAGGRDRNRHHSR